MGITGITGGMRSTTMRGKRTPRSRRKRRKLAPRPETIMVISEKTGNMYTDGSYVAKTGGNWHLQDSPFKARWICRMLARHRDFHPATVCEIGCGAGGILSELQKPLPHVRFTGYEISPQAHEISSRFANSH